MVWSPSTHIQLNLHRLLLLVCLSSKHCSPFTEPRAYLVSISSPKKLYLLVTFLPLPSLCGPILEKLVKVQTIGTE